MEHLDTTQVVLKYEVAWQEIVADMYDEVKSVSSGFASFDYDEAGKQRPTWCARVRGHAAEWGDGGGKQRPFCHVNVFSRDP